MCAMGYADTDCDVTKADVYYISKAGEILVCENGLGLQFDEELAKDMPVCIAKTQYSLSDDPTLLGRPTDFEITVKEVKLSNGAGFVVALTGDIMTMPGLPKVPAANRIDMDKSGTITGLF